MTRIALISDIHFGKLSRTNDFSVPGEPLISEEIGGKSLKEELISKFKDEKIKYLIVAGDLTSEGNPNEFILCNEAILEIAQKSGIDRDNITIALGNHDIDWNISKLSDAYKNPTEQLRKNVSDSYLTIAGSVASQWINDSESFDLKGPAPFSGLKECEDAIFFTLNSGWLCTHENSIKQGRLDNSQLIWLEEQLKLRKDSLKWKILILHHHPFNYPYPLPISDHSVLVEGPELTEIIGKNGINIVCHGHRHHPRVKNIKENGWSNSITFISSGSLSVNVAHRGENIPNLFHVIELCEDKSFYLRSYRFRPIYGWKEISENDNYTPIDFEMYFKEPFTQVEVKKSIKAVCNFKSKTNRKELEEWKNLPAELKSLPIKELNIYLKEYCAENNITVYGEFPQNNVALYKKVK